MKLKNRVALITGAGRGIGRALAEGFAREGADLVLIARTKSELEKTAERIQPFERRVLVIPADVSDSNSVNDFCKIVLEEFGRIDILVNNAGRQPPIGSLGECDIQDWTKTIMVNLIGTVFCCKAVIPHMIKQRHGKIINLSGGGATAPRPYFSAYAASKAGVVRLADTLAEELKPYNIQINVVAPGLVDTRLQDEVLAAGSYAGGLFDKIRQARETGTGAVSPDIAASLAVFLASPASGKLTGKLIAAPYDPWREWAGKAEELNATPLYTIRRLDPFTIKPLLKGLGY